MVGLDRVPKGNAETTSLQLCLTSVVWMEVWVGEAKNQDKGPDNIGYRFVWLWDYIQSRWRDGTKAALYLGQAEGNNCGPLDETIMNWDGKRARELTLPEIWRLTPKSPPG